MVALKQIQASDTWALRHKVMWPDKSIDFVMLPNDAEGLHYGLFENGQLVSVISMFIEGEKAQFRKFATDTTYQSKGYGSQLLIFLIKEAQSLGVKELTCDARVSASGFYERFDMQICSGVFQKSGKDYVTMRLEI